MLTKENIKTLIDDLRFGKYDTSDYELECKSSYDCGYLDLKDKKHNVHIRFRVFSGYNICTSKILWFKKFNTCSARLEIYFDHGSTTIYQISDKFYHSVYTFIAEQVEKDRLLEQTNIKAAFNL